MQTHMKQTLSLYFDASKIEIANRFINKNRRAILRLLFQFIYISLFWLNLRKYSYKWKENANTNDLKISK